MSNNLNNEWNEYLDAIENIYGIRIPRNEGPPDITIVNSDTEISNSPKQTFLQKLWTTVFGTTHK